MFNRIILRLLKFKITHVYVTKLMFIIIRTKLIVLHAYTGDDLTRQPSVFSLESSSTSPLKMKPFLTTKGTN